MAWASYSYLEGEPRWRLVGGDLYDTTTYVECEVHVQAQGPKHNRLYSLYFSHTPSVDVLYEALWRLPSGNQRVYIHGLYFVWDGDTLHPVE